MPTYTMKIVCRGSWSKLIVRYATLRIRWGEKASALTRKTRITWRACPQPFDRDAKPLACYSTKSEKSDVLS